MAKHSKPAPKPEISAADKIDREHGGVLTFPLPAGTYDVESFGPWHPDERTELWLTRVVRAGH